MKHQQLSSEPLKSGVTGQTAVPKFGETDEQIQREKFKHEDPQLRSETKRAIERDKNRKEDRHPGKSENEKRTGYQEHRNWNGHSRRIQMAPGIC